MKHPYEPTAAQLLRLGGEWERAEQARDFDRLTALQHTVQLYDRHASYWIAPFIVRGRNAIRRHRGLEEINV